MSEKFDSLSEEELQKKLEENESTELTEKEIEEKKNQQQKEIYEPKWPEILNKESDHDTGAILTKKEEKERRENK